MLRFLVLTAVTGVFRVTCNTSSTAAIATTTMMKATDFEVFGKVQGVFFRKCTKQHADKLGLRGWCKNTAKGTVQGHMEGPTDKVENMVHWLQNTGSPSSRIERAEFKNERDITEFTYEDFAIVKD